MIYYLRHGETIWNRAQRLQGRLDSPLTERGVEMAVAYGAWLAGVIDREQRVRIRSSPMGRARRTAEVVAESLGLAADAVRTCALLAEHDVGEWAGLRWVEIERDYGRTAECLRDWDHRPPGGETRREMFERARQFLAAPRDEDVSIVIGHGGLSRAIRGAYLRLPVEELNALPSHFHGRLYVLCEGRVREVVADGSEPPSETLLG